MLIDTEYFTQHIHCSRDDKQESLYVVRQLIELAVAARSEGLLALDRLLEDEWERYSAPFLRKAMQMTVDLKSVGKIKQVLYNSILASNYTGRQFLTAVVITEAMAAIHEEEELDYIFRFLVPSFYGISFESQVVAVYDQFRAGYRPKG